MAVDDSYTKLLLHCNGSDASTTFTDESGKTVTAGGNAQIDTAQSKFGGASGLFDGSGDFLSIPDSEDFNFSTGDFTIDLWVRFNSLGSNNFLFGHGQDSNNNLSLNMQISGSNYLFQFAIVDSGTILVNYYDSGRTINTGQWYHIAVVRNGTSWKTYLDGVNIASQTVSATSPNYTSAFIVGARSFDQAYCVNGWIDEFRVSKGIARWTANFTPPTAEYAPPVGPTNLKIFNGLAKASIKTINGLAMANVKTLNGLT